MDVVDEVRARGGVAVRSRLPRRPVDRAIREGRLVVPSRGLVADPGLEPSVLGALSVGGVLSCASAALAHGIDLIDPPVAVHVTVPRSRHRRCGPPAGVVVHRRDAPTLDGISTTLARTAADCVRCLPRRDALVVADQVLARGVDLAEVLAHLTGRRGAPSRRVLEQASPLAGSSGETVGRVVLEDAGLRVQPQVFVPGVGFVDLLVEGRLVVEVDGFAYHSDARQFALDRRRDAALVSLGYLVVRFTWLDVVRRPQYVVATVLAILARER
jgi:very-short-patch-repair endonuclease